jgi:hypothetical protein
MAQKGDTLSIQETLLSRQDYWLAHNWFIGKKRTEIEPASALVRGVLNLDCNNPLHMEMGRSLLKDHLTARLKEDPNAPPPIEKPASRAVYIPSLP